MNSEPLILLYRGRSFVDTIIRWQTWGSVAHAALWVPNGTLVEAATAGVIQRQNVDPLTEPAERYTVPSLSAAGWMRAIDYAYSQVGKPYDFKGLFQFLARDGGINPRAWFCSDLIFESVRQGGVTLVERVPRCKVSPEQLKRSPLLVRV